MRFTLDTNCIIDVEDGRPSRPHVQQLVAVCRERGFPVGVSAIGASERKRNGGYAKTFSEFQEKLKAVGLDSLELLLPPAYADVSYCDYCVCGDENDPLERQIHAVLFPGIPFLWSDCASSQRGPDDVLFRKWKNAKCDVLALWCHITHRGDVFVTSDLNFHAQTKHDRLQSLGGGAIAMPIDALAVAKRS